ncbi:MAG: hypothetical protein AAF497_24380, partial [Planctomycetota bacterium]
GDEAIGLGEKALSEFQSLFEKSPAILPQALEKVALMANELGILYSRRNDPVTARRHIQVGLRSLEQAQEMGVELPPHLVSLRARLFQQNAICFEQENNYAKAKENAVAGWRIAKGAAEQSANIEINDLYRHLTKLCWTLTTAEGNNRESLGFCDDFLATGGIEDKEFAIRRRKIISHVLLGDRPIAQQEIVNLTKRENAPAPVSHLKSATKHLRMVITNVKRRQNQDHQRQRLAGWCQYLVEQLNKGGHLDDGLRKELLETSEFEVFRQQPELSEFMASLGKTS